MATKEQILAALFARLQTEVPSAQRFTRQFRDYDQFDAYPVLLLVADSYTPQQERGRPTTWLLRALAVAYAKSPEEEVGSLVAETQVNAIVDEVETALRRKSSEPVTDMSEPMHTNLGGLCSRCWIAGPIEIFQGDVSGQIAVSIPIEILSA